MGGGKTSRIHYLDIAKGMLIIMLVFAHFRSASIRFDYQNAGFSYIYDWNNIYVTFFLLFIGVALTQLGVDKH